jgi:hypothetical protein
MIFSFKNADEIIYLVKISNFAKKIIETHSIFCYSDLVITLGHPLAAPKRIGKDNRAATAA